MSLGDPELLIAALLVVDSKEVSSATIAEAKTELLRLEEVIGRHRTELGGPALLHESRQGLGSDHQVLVEASSRPTIKKQVCMLFYVRTLISNMIYAGALIRTILQANTGCPFVANIESIKRLVMDRPEEEAGKSLQSLSFFPACPAETTLPTHPVDYLNFLASVASAESVALSESNCDLRVARGSPISFLRTPLPHVLHLVGFTSCSFR